MKGVVSVPKTQVALLFGGRSGEHEVSRNSAYSVAKALSSTYNLFSIGISKTGEWYGPIPIEGIKDFTPEKYLDRKVTILPNPDSKGKIYSLPDLELLWEAKVFFPVLHGTFGEDGTVQGLFEMADIAYVGAGVLASATGMDKVIMKKLFAQEGLPQVDFIAVSRQEVELNPDQVILKIEEDLGYPCFIKPANMGSSVGVSKATRRVEVLKALQMAAKYDQKIIVEQGVQAREIEVSVLGNDEPEVSIAGEIIPSNDFYDYQAKYLDDRSGLIIPAPISAEQMDLIRKIAVQAYKCLDCSGLARVDFFLTKDTQEILINEINTMPGFTNISMYPKLWEHSGVAMQDLVVRLIELALERHHERGRNTFSYN